MTKFWTSAGKRSRFETHSITEFEPNKKPKNFTDVIPTLHTAFIGTRSLKAHFVPIFKTTGRST